MVTSALMPWAIVAAATPTTPPPITTTFHGRTPGTPPSNTPAPPLLASRAEAPT